MVVVVDVDAVADAFAFVFALAFAAFSSENRFNRRESIIYVSIVDIEAEAGLLPPEFSKND